MHVFQNIKGFCAFSKIGSILMYYFKNIREFGAIFFFKGKFGALKKKKKERKGKEKKRQTTKPT